VTPPERAPAPALEPSAGHGETLLVCEDDAGVRALLERMLRSAQYEVLIAGTPAEAIQLVDAGARPDALVSDTIMPGLTGPQLAERLGDYVPALPTLFISGYTADVIHDRGQLPAASAFLEKPFSPAALLDAVRSLLDRANDDDPEHRAGAVGRN
jgi:CheY-like chemotaxis protein